MESGPKLATLCSLETSESILDAAFALVLLAVLDWSIWWSVCSGLSMDYGKVRLGTIPRAFPGRKPFLIAKLLLGFCFFVSFVVTVGLGASEHLALVVLSLALLIPFGISSFWESVRAFRHYAARCLPPVDRDGYIPR